MKESRVTRRQGDRGVYLAQFCRRVNRRQDAATSLRMRVTCVVWQTHTSICSVYICVFTVRDLLL